SSGLKLFCCTNRKLNFGAGGNDDQFRGTIRRLHTDVGALGNVFVLVVDRQSLTTQDQTSWLAVLEDRLPSNRCFIGIGWANNVQVRDRTVGGQVLNWLVSRTIFAKAD